MGNLQRRVDRARGMLAVVTPGPPDKVPSEHKPQEAKGWGVIWERAAQQRSYLRQGGQTRGESPEVGAR